MLTSIRARATGWIAWAIVILISIPFALWGVNSYFGEIYEINVAVVDGEEIDLQTYQRALYIERDNYRQQMGENVDSDFLSSSVLGRQVVDQLVRDLLLFQDARSNGYYVGDEALAKAIRRAPMFLTDEKFDQSRYERLLQFSGYSVPEFEELQRQLAAVSQIRSSFLASSFSVDQSVNEVLKVVLQTRDGDYALIEPERFASEIEVSEEDIQAEYDQNLSLYTEPEKIKVEYIQLLLSDFAKDYEPTEETLQQLYEVDIAQFLREESRFVSHVLIKPDGESEEDEAKALEEATEVAEKAKAGEDFGELVSNHSDDTGSVEQGGSIGEVNRGATVPEFEEVAFSLSEGEISGPVKSTFGFHIIRVDEIKKEETKPFEEVRDELVDSAIKQQAEDELGQILEEVRNIAYEQPDNLLAVSDAFGLEIQESEWFSRDAGSGIADNNKIRDVAFSELVLKEEFNSDLVELDVENYVVLRKLQFQDTAQLGIDEVRDEITEKLLAQKSEEQAQNLGERLVDAVKSGDEWTEVLAENNLEPLPNPGREGEDNYDSYLIANMIYSASLPKEDGVAYGSGSLSDGRYVIYRIVSSEDGNPESAEEEMRQQVQAQISNRFGVELYDSYVSNLRQIADVKIYDDAL